MQPVQTLKLVLSLLIALYWTGCSYSARKAPEASANVSTELLAKVSYQMVKREVFDRSCISCHGNSGGVSLATYESAVSALDKIKASAIDNRQMPKVPEPALDQNQLNILTAWIQVGGRRDPADGSFEPPPPPPPVLTPNFSSIHALILRPKCISCHRADSDSQANQTPFTTYDEIRNNPRYIVNPDNPEEGESLLTAVLRPGAAKAMPPASSGISPVSPEEVSIIEEWIRNGANND